MSPSRFLVHLVIFLSFILAVSAKGHHRHPETPTVQPPNPVTKAGAALPTPQKPATPTTHPPPVNVPHRPVTSAGKPATPAARTKAAPPPPPKQVTPPAAVVQPKRKGVEAREFLKAHNVVRMKHNQTLYTWDKKLARYARRWALQRAVDCKMIHSMGPYGENMFWGKYEHWTPTDAVESWAVEHKDYNADTNECTPNKMCGHYTQIVWHESRLLGCSRVKCFNGSVVQICEYDPPGNYLGENPFGKVFDTAPLPPPPPHPTPSTATPESATSAPSNSSPSFTTPPPPPSPPALNLHM